MNAKRSFDGWLASPFAQIAQHPGERDSGEGVNGVVLVVGHPGGCGVSICQSEPLHLPRREPSEEGERVAHPLDVGDQCEPLQVADGMEPKLHVLPKCSARHAIPSWNHHNRAQWCCGFLHLGNQDVAVVLDVDPPSVSNPMTPSGSPVNTLIIGTPRVLSCRLVRLRKLAAVTWRTPFRGRPGVSRTSVSRTGDRVRWRARRRPSREWVAHSGSRGL